MHKELGYKSISINFQQEKLDSMLSAQLMDYGTRSEWKFQVFQIDKKTFVYEGNLQETIDSILLGKLCKEQLEKLVKVVE